MACVTGVGRKTNANAIGRRPLVILRPKMRVALDDEQPPLRVEVHADGMNDVRRCGEEFDFEPRIGRDGNFLGGEAACGDEECGEDEDGADHEVTPEDVAGTRVT